MILIIFFMNSLIRLLTRNILVSGLVIFAIIGLVTVLGVQLFAATDYKPSSLFANNYNNSSATSSTKSIAISSQSSSNSISATEININSSTKTGAAASSTSSSSRPLLSYKNPFFPNFELKYDESWKVDNTTKGSVLYENQLLERTLAFGRNGKVFEIILTPLVPTGCAGPELTVASIKDLGNGVFRKKLKNASNESNFATVIYSKSNGPDDCGLLNILTSNIKTSDIPKYKELLPSDSNVRYLFRVKLNALNVDSPESDFEVVDKIIADSKFE